MIKHIYNYKFRILFFTLSLLGALINNLFALMSDEVFLTHFESHKDKFDEMQLIASQDKNPIGFYGITKLEANEPIKGDDKIKLKEIMKQLGLYIFYRKEKYEGFTLYPYNPDEKYSDYVLSKGFAYSKYNPDIIFNNLDKLLNNIDKINESRMFFRKIDDNWYIYLRIEVKEIGTGVLK